MIYDNASAQSIKAKRPCRAELPKCPRCLEKGIDCKYDLEPVTNTSTSASTERPHGPADASRPQVVREPFPAVVYDSIQAAHADAVKNYTPNGLDPNYKFPACSTPETFALAFAQLNEIPLATFQHRTTPFCHAQISRLAWANSKDGAAQEREVSAELLWTVMEAKQNRLLSLDLSQQTSFSQFLDAFHQLMAILLASTLSKARGGDEISGLAQLRFLFHKWTQHFHSHLPRTLQGHLSPWQAWTLAETTRRTIIFVIMVEVLLEMVDRGYFYYRPMVESLPFDARTGVWEANTEEEWQAVISEHWEGVDCSLVSWHEFIERGGPEPRKEQDGMLQRLLLVAYFSKDAAMIQKGEAAK
ncbi:hypothetical protein LTS17_012141 [Exophiala oligosperma]